MEVFGFQLLINNKNNSLISREPSSKKILQIVNFVFSHFINYSQGGGAFNLQAGTFTFDQCSFKVISFKPFY